MRARAWPWLLAALLVAALACGNRGFGPGTHERSLRVDGRERGYLLRIPPVFDRTTKLPLVLVFHGGGGNADNAWNMSGMAAAADARFIAVFPNGTGRLDERLLTWNSGNCCGYALQRNVDDVGFVRALVARLIDDLPVDESRIFATGMSNGAMLT